MEAYSIQSGDGFPSRIGLEELGILEGLGDFGEAKLQGEQVRMEKPSRCESRVRVRRTNGAIEKKKDIEIWNNG